MQALRMSMLTEGGGGGTLTSVSGWRPEGVELPSWGPEGVHTHTHSLTRYRHGQTTTTKATTATTSGSTVRTSHASN